MRTAIPHLSAAYAGNGGVVQLPLAVAGKPLTSPAPCISISQVIRNQVPADQLMAWSAEYFKGKINAAAPESKDA